MYFVTAARYPQESYEGNVAVKNKVDGVKHHLEELALDNGFDPEKNVTLLNTDGEVRVGVSEEFDLFLREAPGAWRYY